MVAIYLPSKSIGELIMASKINEMTKYRIYHDGEVEWLQYLHVRKWWFDSWKYVRSDFWDYWDEQWEMHDERFGNSPSRREMLNRYINSYNRGCIQEFVNEYPDVNKWLGHRNRIVGEKRRREYEHRNKNLQKINSLVGYKDIQPNPQRK